MKLTIRLCVLMLMLITVLVVGCSGGGPAAKIPDAELRTKWKKCKTLKNPSRIKVMACENYERECARRKKDGNRAC